MKAAVIGSLERGRRFADFDEPVVAGGEHYGSEGMLPMISGIDGMGRAADGTLVHFAGVRPPYCSIFPPGGACLGL
jgi:hypothetical protein